jgi:hypothetical protein
MKYGFINIKFNRNSVSNFMDEPSGYRYDIFIKHVMQSVQRYSGSAEKNGPVT